MNAKRHKRWMIPILVLLPSILAIATLSLSGGISGHSRPADGEAPATPAGEGVTDEPSRTPVNDDSPSISSGHSEQSDSSADPYIEADRDEDPEYRPVFHERMLAANYPEPQFRDDAVHGFSSASSAGGGRFGRGISGAGSAGAGGSSGGASNGSSANTKAEDNSPDEESETTEGSNGDTTRPDTFEDSGKNEQSGSNEPSNTNPFEPKAPGQGDSASGGPENKDDSINRTDTDETSGEGPGPKDEDKNEPIVSDDTDLYTDVLNPVDTESDYPPEQPHVSVPEPSTLGLLGIALLGMAVSRKRRAGAGTKR